MFGFSSFSGAPFSDPGGISLPPGYTIGLAIGSGTATGIAKVTIPAAGAATGVGAASGALRALGTLQMFGTATGAGTASGAMFASGTLQTAGGGASGIGTASGGGSRKFELDISETLNMHGDPYVAQVVVLTETTLASGALTYAFRPGAEMDEEVILTDIQPTQMKYYPALAEGVSIAGPLSVAYPRVLSETANMTASLSAARGVTLLETLGITNTLGPRMSYHPILTEMLTMSPALSRFLSASMAETANITLAQSPYWRFSRSMAEVAAVTDALSRKMIFRVVANETVSIDDNDLLHMIFRPTMAETIEINILTWAPNGNITTWAVNTLTGGTTEYSNYEFNSFARFGGKYIAASSSGLFELDGDTDAGTSIIADIKGGYAQFGGSKFSGFAAAYLGLRGDGNFTFRLISGDGKTYDYLVKSHTMKTTKVNMGKGLRARYFAYELISTGQDFDLDNIEFIPMVAKRRV